MSIRSGHRLDSRSVATNFQPTGARGLGISLSATQSRLLHQHQAKDWLLWERQSSSQSLTEAGMGEHSNDAEQYLPLWSDADLKKMQLQENLRQSAIVEYLAQQSELLRREIDELTKPFPFFKAL